MIHRSPHLASKNDCTGCMACVDSCKQQAIKSYLDDDGHRYVRVNNDHCIGCLKCEKVCLGREVFKGSNELTESLPFAAWAIDNSLRSRSTSGGVFAAIATAVIKEGGIVVGASFDGRYAKHVVVEDEYHLCSLQGSKYVQSNTEGIFLAIADHLPKQKVLFSGVGCQVAAVLSFFSSHPHKDNLYTIDLICGGVPSDVLMEKYFNENKGLDAITSFRSKRHYELKGVVNGKEQVLGRPLPIAGFATEMTNRYSCYNCQFAYAHRRSDITIGDLWGKFCSEDERNKGISLAISHNARGFHLLEGASIKLTPIKWDSFLRMNARLVIGDTPMTFLRRRLSRNIRTMSYKQFQEAYSSIPKITHPILFIDKVIRVLHRRIKKMKDRVKINRLLLKCR